MPPRPFHRSCFGSRDGVALVIVLAFIVLTSILIISFISFSSSNRLSTSSYAKSIQAQEIAQGGLQDILSDLHQEIVAGSSAPSASAGSPVYIPTTNWTAQPARLGYSAASYTNDVSSTLLPPTLVRVSRASQDGTPTDLYPPMTNSYFSGGSIPTNRASAANSSNNSFNGRYISAARWNQISLLSTNTTIPPAFATNTPDWVYVTRSGSRACTTNDLFAATNSILPSNNLETTSAVVGRYAYVVYDEGALVDINTAGYLSTATNNFTKISSSTAPTNSYTPVLIGTVAGPTQLSTGKTYLAYADLTQLPGLNTAGGQTNIDALVKWRNAANLSSSSVGTNYYRTVYNYTTNGFTSFQSGDSPLLSRQDLLNYVAKNDPAKANIGQALPYLGTFSRTANAPSWHPIANSQNLTGYYGLSSPGYTFNTSIFGNVAYKDNAETSGTANRDIPNVRFPTSGTQVVHYNDDGTKALYKDANGNLQPYYTVQAGDPLIQHRFSLAKLAWLTRTGPASGIDPAAIKACFGLQWDGQNFGIVPYHFDRWDYVAGTTGPVTIETLDQVAAEGREPNFFEMLKAGILSGSLGQSPGPLSGATYEGVDGTGFETFSIEKNRHILQIGANIIDQADSDSIPTAIYLQMFGVIAPATTITTEDDVAFNTVYGDENLPGLTRVFETFIEDWYDTSASPNVGYAKSWLVPEIWNIHQPPSPGVDMSVAGTPGYPRPLQLRIHAYGKFDWEITNSNGPNLPTSLKGKVSTPIDWDDTVTSYPYHDATGTTPSGSTSDLGVLTGGKIPNSTTPIPASSTSNPGAAGLTYFTDFSTAKSPFYRNPFYLQYKNMYFSGFTGYNGTNPLNAYAPVADLNMPNGDPSFQFVGIFGGEMQWPDLTPSPGAGIQFNSEEAAPIFFSVECQDPQPPNNWHPYNFISRVAMGGGGTRPIWGDNANTVAAANPNYVGTPGGSGAHAANGQTYSVNRGGCIVRPDPRTDRFSVSTERMSEDQAPNGSMYPFPGQMSSVEDNFPMRTYGFVYTPNPPAAPSVFGSSNQGGFSITMPNWAVNASSGGAFYVDPDGVLRPGDSYRANFITGDGALLFDGCGGGASFTPSSPSSANTATINTNPTSVLPTAASGTGSSVTGSAQARRPVILNRPFRNVGELGYTFRDLPFKSIDFFSSASGDGALLDLFCVNDEPSTTAGQIDLSNAPAAALMAIMNGATKMEINAAYTTAYDSSYSVGVNATTGAPNFMTSAEASKVASGLVASFNASGPLNNRADLVSRLDPIITSLCSTNPDYGNKAYAEAPLRALSGVANTRTWNLLIDIIAQSGQFSPTATTLNDFVVQGERRYWLHIAIDRYTGKIVDQQLEPVYD